MEEQGSKKIALSAGGPLWRYKDKVGPWLSKQPDGFREIAHPVKHGMDLVKFALLPERQAKAQAGEKILPTMQDGEEGTLFLTFNAVFLQYPSETLELLLRIRKAFLQPRSARDAARLLIQADQELETDDATAALIGEMFGSRKATAYDVRKARTEFREWTEWAAKPVVLGVKKKKRTK